MEKILVSWIAYQNDFKDGEVNREQSPNYQFHKHYWNYNRHLLLSSSAGDDNRMIRLTTCLRNEFPDHTIEEVYMDVKDVINLPEIKQKTEHLLLRYLEHELDLFFSPGTSVMQVAWYICHTTLGLRTRLLQLRPASLSQGKIPELLEIKVEMSETPISAILSEKSLNTERVWKGIDNYLILPSIKPIYANAFKVAQTEGITTLITGASGTGKEHLARFIHANSVRREKPMITVNCSAFHDSLLESRLFGYKKGAFTGAIEDTPGLFRKANGGIIFLDEIGDISPYMQQSLLRVLQEKQITPVGGTPEDVNVQVIAATNKNLPELCDKNMFRWDLYFRLNVVRLEMPSLQERGKKEVKEMVNFFLKMMKKELRKKNILKFEPEALKMLLQYPFPGNIRELENLIKHFYVFCSDIITVDDLPATIRNSEVPGSFLLSENEKQHIVKVLRYYQYNLSQSANALGCAYNTLKAKMKEYDIQMPEN